MRRLLGNRAWLWSTTCLSTIGFAGPLAAADVSTAYGALAHSALPAVSELNGKFGAFGGSVGGRLAYGGAASITVPVGERFGLQFDGLIGSAREALFYGVGGHAFTRDPAKGLVGLYGSYVGWNTTETIGVVSPVNGFADIVGAGVAKVGVEAEAYVGRLSFEGLFGYQFGSVSGVTGKATLAVYPADTLRLDAGLRYLTGPGVLWTAGAEWQPHGRSMSVFANGTIGADGFSQAFGGVRFYGGEKEKPLIRRHREDDPGNETQNDLHTILGPGYCPPGTENVDDFCDGLP